MVALESNINDSTQSSGLCTGKLFILLTSLHKRKKTEVWLMHEDPAKQMWLALMDPEKTNMLHCSVMFSHLHCLPGFAFFRCVFAFQGVLVGWWPCRNNGPQSCINTTKAQTMPSMQQTDKEMSVLCFHPFVWPPNLSTFFIFVSKKKAKSLCSNEQDALNAVSIAKMRSFMFFETTATTKPHTESRSILSWEETDPF